MNDDLCEDALGFSYQRKANFTAVLLLWEVQASARLGVHAQMHQSLWEWENFGVIVHTQGSFKGLCQRKPWKKLSKQNACWKMETTS